MRARGWTSCRRSIASSSPAGPSWPAACHGNVLQHAAPERLIRGGLPTERLVAHVIDAKYHWHLPLYRQAQMLATHGIVIDCSTLAFWVGYAAQELKPLWHRLRQLLLASSKLCVDETPAPVLDPGRQDQNWLLLGAVTR